MYKKIMVPVDLGHVERLAGALSVAGQMAEMCGAELLYAGVYGAEPSAVAPDTAAYLSALEAFVAKQPAGKTHAASALPLFAHDPAVEVAAALVEAAKANGVDLIVMASHVPGWIEHMFHSNAGYVASHAPMSVFVVR